MSTRSIRAILATLTLALVAPRGATADVHPNLGRGFAADKAFQIGDIDHVNLFNGNLVVTIPVGQSYPVNGTLSYGVSLVFNSNAWNFIEREAQNGQIFQQARVNKRANAGFGWTLSMGRLESPATDPNDTGKWLYIGPDGSEHPFFTTLHEEENPDPDPDVYYTRDGSYMRLKFVGAAASEIEMPNGEVHRFGGGEVEVTKISDRFGNWVSRTTLPGGNWEIKDSQDRIHSVTFTGSGTNRRVSAVALVAFGGSAATYTFGYTPASLAYPCPHNDTQFPGPISVYLLSSVTLPAAAGSFSIPEYYLDQSAGCRTPGSIRSLVLPTLGKVGWTYREYVFPAGGRIARNRSNGVAARTLYNADGTLIGSSWQSSSWQYTTALDGVELLNSVTTPLGHKSEHFFSTSLDATGTTWNLHEYGLPLTHRAGTADSTGARFLSRREYGTGNVLLRSSYVRYERDTGTLSDSTEATKLNQRLASSRMVYEDDAVTGSPQGGKRFADEDFSDFDGLGHYRSGQAGGNFPSGNVKGTFARYNPTRNTYPGTFSMWPVDTPWILNTFDRVDKIEDGVTARRTFDLDFTTGWVSRTRIHAANSGGEGSTDVIVETIHDGHGNLGSERHYGGDVQSVAVVTPLSAVQLPSTPQYRIDYATQYGSRASATYTDAAGQPLTFKSLDQTIDPTGLPSSSRDSTLIETAFDYDSSGRLTFVKPPTGHDGWTEYVYTPAVADPAAPAQVSVYRRAAGSGSSVLAESLIKFDAIGRVWQEQQKMPDGTWSIRETKYNALGWKDTVSEQGDINNKTQYSGYDPFGRPTTITPPDGAAHALTFAYEGVRSVARKVKVGTAYSGGAVNTADAWTTEIYDRQGRLYQVKEDADYDYAANPPTIAATTTTYSYDVGDRLSRVQQSSTAGTQNRWFTYDQRGFLLSEQHPEKGQGGNGVVSYHDYDARGHAGVRKTNGSAELSFSYDRAERPLNTWNGAGQILKELTYGTSNAAAERTNGRLWKAKRYNYPGVPEATTQVHIRETYLYGGPLGRVSQKDTLHIYLANSQTAAANREAFTQSYLYDELGSVRHIDYPTCTFVPSCSSPYSRGVDFTRTKGLLTGITGFVNSISYHPNGLVNQVTHSNLVVDTQSNDPNGMRRPASLFSRRTGFAPTLWSSGSYSYDGAGNVVKMGSGYFLYDHVSRIVDGHVDDGPSGGGTLRYQTYRYDGFGNLTKIIGDPLALGRDVPTSSTTNRLSGTNALYDAAGNLIQAPAPSGDCATGNPCYQYDALGMMTRMRNGAEEWAYIYTANDERIWAVRLAGSPSNSGYLWALRDLDGKVLREYDGFDKPRDYVYRDGQLVASEGVKASFSDVPASHPAAAEVEALLASSITTGCGAGMYCVNDLTPRWQMAVFLIRAMSGPSYVPPACTTPPRFNDVPCSEFYAPWVNELGQRGITGGCGNGNFCPYDPVPPGQMAVFLLRAKAWPNTYNPPPCVTPSFSDYTCADQFAPWAEEVFRRGIDLGCGNGQFCMYQPILRSKMAVLLTRGFSLPYPDVGLGYTKHYHLDHLGTPRLITSNATSKIANHAYFPFGEELTTQMGVSTFPKDAEPMKFTGHERDLGNPASAADDLDYMHARHYNPLTGRFLSTDPIRGSQRAPQSFNLFSYVGGNPLKYVDRDGRWWSLFNWGRATAGAYSESITVTAPPFVGSIVVGTSLADILGRFNDVARRVGDRLGRFEDGPKGGGPSPCRTPVAPRQANINDNIREIEMYRGIYGRGRAILEMANNVQPGGSQDYKLLTADQQLYQDFGNFNFGAVGSAAGFSPTTLLVGAGVVQTFTEYGSSIDWWLNSYGDAPRDTAQITAGIDYYNNINCR